MPQYSGTTQHYKRSYDMNLRGLSRHYAVACSVALILSICASAQQRGYDQSLLKGLQWRSIGPFRGGRSTAVAGVTSQQNVFYFGATGGGVWKTTDGGMNWEPVSDEYFKTGSVGAIGVSESDPNVV